MSNTDEESTAQNEGGIPAIARNHVAVSRTSRSSEGSAGSGSGSGATGGVTILRVKRRRSEDPAPPTLLFHPLEAKDDMGEENSVGADAKRPRRRSRNAGTSARTEGNSDALLENLMHQSTYIAQRQEQRQQHQTGGKAPVVFRRIGKKEDGAEGDEPSTIARHLSGQDGKASTVRIVDARLMPPSNDQEDADKVPNGLVDQKSPPPSKDASSGTGGTTELDEAKRRSKRKRPSVSIRLTNSRTIDGQHLLGAGRHLLESDVSDEQAEQEVVMKKSRKGPSPAGLKDKLAVPSGVTFPPPLVKGRHNRRARSTSSAKSAQRSIVLDPLTRIVDDSLRVLNGTSAAVAGMSSPSTLPALSDHLELFRTDDRILSCQPPRRCALLNWTCSDGSGTILHVASLRNDLDALTDALDMGADPTVLDGDGLTPADVALLTGNHGVLDVLNSHVPMDEGNYDHFALRKRQISNQRAASMQNDMRRRKSKKANSKRENDADFVYDLYYVSTDEETRKLMSAGQPASKDVVVVPSAGAANSQTPQPTAGCDSLETKGGTNDESGHHTVELRGGIGYWNSLGELVMEAHPIPDDEIEREGFNIDDIDDDTNDSNDEDYFGNDYPEEEEDEEDEVEGMGGSMEEVVGMVDDYGDVDDGVGGYDNFYDSYGSGMPAFGGLENGDEDFHQYAGGGGMGTGEALRMSPRTQSSAAYSSADGLARRVTRFHEMEFNHLGSMTTNFGDHYAEDTVDPDEDEFQQQHLHDLGAEYYNMAQNDNSDGDHDRFFQHYRIGTGVPVPPLMGSVEQRNRHDSMHEDGNAT